MRWSYNIIDKHIYDYDAYSLDTEDATYFCAESVMDIIDGYVREKSNFNLESKSMIDSLNRITLKLRASNNCISSVMSGFSEIDTKHKRISGVNIEAVRDIAGPSQFDELFFNSKVFNKKAYIHDLTPERSVQILSLSDSIKHCARFEEPYYPKAVSKLMLKSTVDTLCDFYQHRRYSSNVLSSAFGYLADNLYDAKEVAKDSLFDLDEHFDDCIEYLKEKTDSFDLSKKARDRIAGKKVVPCKRKSLDLSQFYGENKYSDGTDMEFGD